MKINIKDILQKIDYVYKSSFQIPNINFNNIRNNEELNIYYNLIPGFSYAHIYYDILSDQIIYDILEPEISDYEKILIDKAKEYISDDIYRNPSLFLNKDPKIAILEELINFINRMKIKADDKDILRYYYYLWRDMLGLEKIEPLMHDPFVEDISLDGYNIPIYIRHNRFGNIITNIIFNQEELDRFIVKLAQRTGRTISYADPILDASLPDGSRVNATYSKDITSRGPTFTIRKFRKQIITITDLINTGTLNEKVAAYIWWAVENRANILIGGSTASGKTTLLNAISMFIPPFAKVISIEDTRELNIFHQNWIPAVTRRGFYIEGKTFGEIDMYELLKESFRQSPDYVIVGEVRGQEAYVMFQGMASGHSALSTIHTDNWLGLVRRLTTPPINLSRDQLALIDLVIFMIKAPTVSPSARRIREIIEVGKYRNQKLEVTQTVKWDYKDDRYLINNQGKLLLDELYYRTGYKTDLQKSLYEKEMVLKYLSENNIKDPQKIVDIISLYYLDKDQLFYLIEEDEQ